MTAVRSITREEFLSLGEETPRAVQVRVLSQRGRRCLALAPHRAQSIVVCTGLTRYTVRPCCHPTPKGPVQRALTKIASPYDTDARWFAKGGDLFWCGYKVHFTETCDGTGDGAARPNLVTDVATTHSTVPDVHVTAGMQKGLAEREVKRALPRLRLPLRRPGRRRRATASRWSPRCWPTTPRRPRPPRASTRHPSASTGTPARPAAPKAEPAQAGSRSSSTATTRSSSDSLSPTVGPVPPERRAPPQPEAPAHSPCAPRNCTKPLPPHAPSKRTRPGRPDRPCAPASKARSTRPSTPPAAAAVNAIRLTAHQTRPATPKARKNRFARLNTQLAA